ncbi:NAD-dependent epimerase/dehydratase family protein [Sphingomonas sp.]|uniref:NAD-dependent epimerase/dehydratase family protein n=1 Tax=Sphingomonas sp. TaxID=28214 RepID=UPI003CC6AF68
MIIALTGATGFVGRAVLDAASARGHVVRALARRPQPPRGGVTWIEGRLEEEGSLVQLATGADAVLHVAGVVNGTTTDFIRGNVDGTRTMLAAAAAMHVHRFVHVSSLAAREPQLSDYGHSKDRAESEVQAADLDWTIVRPPGVYGPGDLEMRDVFRMAKAGLVLLPPAGRVSLIHVADLARLLVALVERPGAHETYEPDDGVASGHTQKDFAALVGSAVGRRPLALSVPAAILRAAARADVAIRGGRAKLTPDRASYLSHPDWTVDPAKRPPADLWTPQIATPKGLADTAAWYRAEGLL